MSRSAVITGIGVAAPSGTSADEHWATIRAGTGRVGPITLFDPEPYPVRLAGQVPDFDPAPYVDSRVKVQTDRWTWLGFAAAAQALADADVDPAALDPYSVSVALASSSGGNLFGQKELQRLWSQPSRTVGAYQSVAWFYAASVGQLSIKYQFKGASSVLCSEGAGGLDSIAHAARLVRRGASVVLAGGTECPLSPYALVCQLSNGWLSTRDDPARAYRPFDADAAGYVPAEGGAVFVVEEKEHALARGAVIHAEVAGWGATHDGEPTRARSAGSVRQYARAIRLAMDRAGVEPGEVGALFPDALGVPAYDVSESAAIHAAFDGGAPPVTTQKSLTGRLHQGGSALDVATALLAMRDGVLPATTGLGAPAPGCADLDFVLAERRADLRAVMVNARGFDGFNSSLVLRRPSGRPAAGRADDRRSA